MILIYRRTTIDTSIREYLACKSYFATSMNMYLHLKGRFNVLICGSFRPHAKWGNRSMAMWLKVTDPIFIGALAGFVIAIVRKFPFARVTQ